MENILFFSNNIPFKVSSPDLLKSWLKGVARQAEKKIAQLQFIFCDDAYLHTLNRHHLQHDTLTDVITFDYSEEATTLEGDIYVSIDTVRANAETLGVTFHQELCRVMVHGVLHLIGYDDKDDVDKVNMRCEEDRCLALPSVQSWLEKTDPPL